METRHCSIVLISFGSCLFSLTITSERLLLWMQVEGHLKDGDIVVLNRQPSLHKCLLWGRVKVVPGSTFRLNPSITSADFGGDPMRMHVPQSLETRTEVLERMMVPKCMFSPQSNRLEVGLSEDSLLGCCKISEMGTFIEKVTVT